MAKIKGIRLGRKLLKWCIRRRTHRATAAYQLLEHSAGAGPFSKLRRWVQSFTREARCICAGRETSPGYIQSGGNPAAPPKGHLVVYVGEKEGSICRVVVPVLYFNHPLFGSLLREAEKVYGFDHPGGIQIPCPKSELENVQLKIAAAGGGGIWPRSGRRSMDHRHSFFMEI